MMRDEYKYAVELERQDHTRLAQVPVTMDWGPALEWARFRALRESPGAMKPSHGSAQVEPEWDSALGEPYVSGVRISLVDGGSSAPPGVLPRAYFNRAAIEVSRRLIAKELLQPKEKFVYKVVAFRTPRQQQPQVGLALTVEDVAPGYTLKPASSDPFLRSVFACGEAREEDVRVFLPRRVLELAEENTRAAAATEAAGILIGRVCRDPGDGEVFLEITDLIPAKHVRSESTQVTFTPESWSAVDGAIRLRSEGEMMMGWFHSHPAKYWCAAKCSPEQRQACPLSLSFFSRDDYALHRTVFPMAHCVALLVTHAETGLRHALFGWRQGLIVQRGFHVLNAQSGSTETDSNIAIIGEDHEEICA